MDEAEAIAALADWLGALAHPDRLRLVFALAQTERDVASLAQELGLRQPRTSQHLALLKAHDVVVGRREGRRMLYRLADPALVAWVGEAAGFLAARAGRQAELGSLLERLRSEGATDS
ncbi:MAG: metalloregulator ArsR/SmtB family transcription factor [Myxococcota bacterium]